MEELKRMFARQKKFNKNFIDLDCANDYERQLHTKEMVLHAISELDEVLREINWKVHRKEAAKEIRRDKLIEEITDVFKYVLTLYQTWGFEAEDIVREFDRKSEVVEQRYKQEFILDLLKDEKVIGVDIDGVLGAYPEAFVKFIQDETGISLENFEISSYNIYDLLADKIPGGQEEMRKLKHKFRTSGKECDLPLIEGAVKGMNELKALGYTIVLLTARPFKQYPRFFADTINWLCKNSIPYDAILWDENKEEKIVREFPNMNFMIEDVYSNSRKISQKGYKVFLLDKAYNKSDMIDSNINRVKDWEELITKVKNG